MAVALEKVLQYEARKNSPLCLTMRCCWDEENRKMYGEKNRGKESFDPCLKVRNFRRVVWRKPISRNALNRNKLVVLAFVITWKAWKAGCCRASHFQLEIEGVNCAAFMSSYTVHLVRWVIMFSFFLLAGLCSRVILSRIMVGWET